MHLWVPFWVLYFIPSVFVPIPYCLDDYGIVIELKSGIVMSPTLVFLFNTTFAIWGLCGSVQILGLFVLALRKMPVQFCLLLFWRTVFLDKESLTAYFSNSACWIFPATVFWPAKFLWTDLLWLWSVFPCKLRTCFSPCCFHDSFLVCVFCKFDFF